MGYWRQMYGRRSKEFIEGAIASVEAYGIWKEGIQRIGCLDTPVRQVIEEIKKDLGYKEDERNK